MRLKWEQGVSLPSPLTLATDKVIARIHTVHLMNVEQRQAADDPQTKPPDSGCEFAWLYAASIYNDDRHLLLLLSRKADLPSHGRRVEG